MTIIRNVPVEASSEFFLFSLFLIVMSFTILTVNILFSSFSTESKEDEKYVQNVRRRLEVMEEVTVWLVPFEKSHRYGL